MFWDRRSSSCEIWSGCGCRGPDPQLFHQQTAFFKLTTSWQCYHWILFCAIWLVSWEFAPLDMWLGTSTLVITYVTHNPGPGPCLRVWQENLTMAFQFGQSRTCKGHEARRRFHSRGSTASLEMELKSWAEQDVLPLPCYEIGQLEANVVATWPL
jgi:hypothetical protein